LASSTNLEWASRISWVHFGSRVMKVSPPRRKDRHLPHLRQRRSEDALLLKFGLNAPDLVQNMALVHKREAVRFLLTDFFVTLKVDQKLRHDF